MVKKLSEECDIAVMSGSLPKGVDPSFYGEVLKGIPKRVKKIVDTEKENMDHALLCGDIYMIKPNLKELEDLTGQRLKSKKDIITAATQYVDKGVKYVLVSLGEDGAVLTDGTNHYYCRSANVAVNSRVGAGDSMVAAACVGLSRGLPIEEILRMSVAAGTAAITTSGTNLFYKDKYDEIFAKIFVERINP